MNKTSKRRKFIVNTLIIAGPISFAVLTAYDWPFFGFFVLLACLRLMWELLKLDIIEHPEEYPRLYKNKLSEETQTSLPKKKTSPIILISIALFCAGLIIFLVTMANKQI